MFYRWRRQLKRSLFDWQTRGILESPPLRTSSGNVIIASMLCEADVQMYVLAIKAFYRLFRTGRVVVIKDRDVTPRSVAIVREHVPDIEFVGIENIDTGKCQRGGTWERLLYLLDLSRDAFVIQLDADTLTIGPDIDEVLACVRANRAFTLGGQPESPLISMDQASANARLMTDNYIGTVTEQAFQHFPDSAQRKYIRGSSAFVGFAKGGIDRQEVEAFHVTMEKLLGARWREWGTEQCASNYAVANSPDPITLPFPKYSNYWPHTGDYYFKSALLHFVGSFRFDKGYFAAKAREVIAEVSERPR